MKTLEKVVYCLVLAGTTLLLFTGCHTAHGFGEDMENAGQSIQDKTSR